MFLLPDLTTSEAELVATVTTQLLTHRRPSTPTEEQAVRHEAAQVAAEMIQEARAQHRSVDPGDPEEEGLAADLAESGYHQRLRRLAEVNRAIQEAEDPETDLGPPEA